MEGRGSFGEMGRFRETDEVRETGGWASRVIVPETQVSGSQSDTGVLVPETPGI